MSLQKLQWGQALQRVLGCSGSNLAAQVHAEIIVTFEGTTEFGNPFMARQSYLPTEIHWGHKFVSIMGPPPPGQTRYRVDISRRGCQCLRHPSGVYQIPCNCSGPKRPCLSQECFRAGSVHVPNAA